MVGGLSQQGMVNGRERLKVFYINARSLNGRDGMLAGYARGTA